MRTRVLLAAGPVPVASGGPVPVASGGPVPVASGGPVPIAAGCLAKRLLGAALCRAVASWVLGIEPACAQTGQGPPAPPIESGYIDAGGGRLFYEASGTGDCIVLIHDGLIHHEVWDAQFPVLARTHRVVRYDRRGYGKSPEPSAAYSNVADLLRVFEQLGIETAWLAGMSAGGGLAIDFTLAHPERVSGLVLVGAVVSGFDYTTHFYTRGGRMTQQIYNDPEALRAYITTTDPYNIAPSSTAARERARALLEAYPGNARFEKHRLATPPPPALARLEEIRVPTLIVIGEFDIPDVHAHAGAIDAVIPGAQRVVLGGSGHLVPLERPEAFNAEVDTFLREDGSSTFWSARAWRRPLRNASGSGRRIPARCLSPSRA